MLKNIKKYLFPARESEPEKAYNRWSESYDDQPGNLMLDLDEILFSELLNGFSLRDKIIIDVGCGTGRHWKKIYAKEPKNIIGYDVSGGMLEILKKKYPNAEVHKLSSNKLGASGKASCDVVVSTLALAHIENAEEALTEWHRVLKNNGHIVITDYHPDALAKGGNRTFIHKGKQIAIRNYVHPISDIIKIAQSLNLKEEQIKEIRIDESMKHYYEKQNAINVYEKFKGTPIIYGLVLFKEDAAK